MSVQVQLLFIRADDLRPIALLAGTGSTTREAEKAAMAGLAGLTLYPSETDDETLQSPHQRPEIGQQPSPLP